MMRARSFGRSSSARTHVSAAAVASSLAESRRKLPSSLSAVVALLAHGGALIACGPRSCASHGLKQLPLLSKIHPAVVGVSGWYKHEAEQSPWAYNSLL